MIDGANDAAKPEGPAAELDESDLAGVTGGARKLAGKKRPGADADPEEGGEFV